MDGYTDENAGAALAEILTSLLTLMQDYGLPLILAAGFLILVYWLLKNYMPAQTTAFREELAEERKTRKAEAKLDREIRREEAKLEREARLEIADKFQNTLTTTMEIRSGDAKEYRKSMEKVVDGHKEGMSRNAESIDGLRVQLKENDESNRALTTKLVGAISAFSAATGEAAILPTNGASKA